MTRQALCSVAAGIWTLTAIAAAPPDRISFNRDVRPIMSDTCFRCHGPDRNAHKELTAAQRDVLRRWIEEGAAYEGHWAYQPVKRPPVPAVADASGIKNPNDNFIRDGLTRAGLTPASEADRRTLLRRATL